MNTAIDPLQTRNIISKKVVLARKMWVWLLSTTDIVTDLEDCGQCLVVRLPLMAGDELINNLFLLQAFGRLKEPQNHQSILHNPSQEKHKNSIQ